MWPSMVVIVIVIVDGVDVVLSAVCISGKFSFFCFLFFSLSLSVCSFVGTSFLTPAFRYVSRPYLSTCPVRCLRLSSGSPPFLSRSSTRCCQPENVNLSHEHVRIFSMRLGLGDDLFSGARWIVMKEECEGGAQRNVLRVLAEKWHDCFIANVVMLKCRTQIS